MSASEAWAWWLNGGRNPHRGLSRRSKMRSMMNGAGSYLSVRCRPTRWTPY